jgi:hypothetical protein
MKRFVFLAVSAALFISGMSVFAQGFGHGNAGVSGNQNYVISVSADNQNQSFTPMQVAIYGRGRGTSGNADQIATPAQVSINQNQDSSPMVDVHQDRA